jgi:hypothetical protein
LRRPDSFAGEDSIFRELEERRNAIWGDLLNRLGAIADALLAVRDAPPLPFRMADFANFGYRISKSKGQEAEWLRLLGRLEKAQARFAGEGDGIVVALARLLEIDQGQVSPIASADLFSRCVEIAKPEGLSMPRTASGFDQKLSNMRRVIELELSARYSEDIGRSWTQYIVITRR